MSRTEKVPSLVAPALLIAMPQVADPFFARSVIFLVHHDEGGSLGYIVNRPTEVRVTDVCRELGIAWGGDPSMSVHFGGPVQAEVGVILCRAPELQVSPTALAVSPGLFVSSNRDDLRQVAGNPPAEFRLLLGYAGWGPGQIDGEVLRGDWLTAEADPRIVFSGEPESAWRRALASIGVDPGAIPTLTDRERGSVN